MTGDGAAPHIGGERSPSTERHARESTARAGQMAQVSRETMRKYGVVSRAAPELLDEVHRAAMSLETAYRTAIDDKRKPIYLTLPAWLEASVAADASTRGVSRQTVIEEVVTGWYDDENPARS